MEGVKTAARPVAEEGNRSLKNAAVHAVYLGLGFLVSRGAVLGNLAPFGASFVAAVPGGRLAAALTGAALGYIVRKPEDSFRHRAGDRRGNHLWQQWRPKHRCGLRD